MIYKLISPERSVIGLMSELPINRSFDPATRQMREPWVIVQQIEQLFELRTVPPTSDSIDAEIDVLMIQVLEQGRCLVLQPGRLRQPPAGRPYQP